MGEILTVETILHVIQTGICKRKGKKENINSNYIRVHVLCSRYGKGTRPYAFDQTSMWYCVYWRNTRRGKSDSSIQMPECNLPQLVTADAPLVINGCAPALVLKIWFGIHLSLSLCWHALAHGPDMAATLWALRAEYYLWRSVRLKLFGWLVAQNLVLWVEARNLILPSESVYLCSGWLLENWFAMSCTIFLFGVVSKK